MPHKQTFRKSKKNKLSKLSKLSKNTNKKSKYSKKSKKNVRSNKMKGGNCGCGNNIMHGGNLQTSQFYYPLNNHNNDPLAPTNIVDSRQLPNFVGGSKRKMKGGMNGTSLFTAIPSPFFQSNNLLNPIISQGDIAGSISSNNILTGQPVLDNISSTTQLSTIDIKNPLA
jgi:hypothetical protein